MGCTCTPAAASSQRSGRGNGAPSEAGSRTCEESPEDEEHEREIACGSGGLSYPGRGSEHAQAAFPMLSHAKKKNHCQVTAVLWARPGPAAQSPKPGSGGGAARSQCVCLLRVRVLCVLGVVRALAVHSRCVPSCWACGVLVQHSSRSCALCSSKSSTSRGCTGLCFVLALCMLALSRLRLPCSRCVYPLCMRLLCMPSFLRACVSHARVVCTCCACPCYACPRCAPSCGVWCACAAHAYVVRCSLTSPTQHPSSTPAT